MIHRKQKEICEKAQCPAYPVKFRKAEREGTQGNKERGQSEGSSKPRGNEPQAVGVESEWATCSVLLKPMSLRSGHTDLTAAPLVLQPVIR